MADAYTLKKLTDVKDSAPQFGYGEFQEARFAGKGLELIAFGPHHKGDEEIIQGWWAD